MVRVVFCVFMVMALVTPLARGQCATYIYENGPCTNGADADCCNFLTQTTNWGPHVESIWCVCQALLIADAPVTSLNDCGVVQGTDPYC
ncbi:hypothetical protein HanIR_Chr16g0788521 [Helianthus annuus]|nr:hypothetical protein HanIR_Chr16g0788521 [Helianthus annuus]